MTNQQFVVRIGIVAAILFVPLVVLFLWISAPS